jgi:malate dehydrogenase (oxaloacetate-decarboxylating)(NADP+)
MGYTPRVAMLSYSTFGQPVGERSLKMRNAVKVLEERKVDFEFDGEMAADIALNPELRDQYSFCKLSGPANVLVMPAIHSASISTKMLEELGGSTLIGPLLVGLNKSVQIASMGAKDSDIVNMAAIAAYNSTV